MGADSVSAPERKAFFKGSASPLGIMLKACLASSLPFRYSSFRCIWCITMEKMAAPYQKSPLFAKVGDSHSGFRQT